MQSELLLLRMTIKLVIFGGKHIIRSMHKIVADILEMLSSQKSNTVMLVDFYFLGKDDIKASLLFASLKINHLTFHAA